MFKRLPEAEPSRTSEAVAITIDDQTVTCGAHELLATVLLASGRLDCRDSAVSGAPRGPFCMMGICYDCMVEIDGLPNRQACITRVRQGMRAARQRGARTVA